MTHINISSSNIRPQGIYPAAGGKGSAHSAIKDSPYTHQDQNQSISHSSSIAGEQWECTKVEWLWLPTNTIKTQGWGYNQETKQLVWAGKGGALTSTFGVQVTGLDPDYEVIQENPDVIPDKLKAEFRSNHIGCPDVLNGKVYLPLEDGEKDQDGKHYQHPVIAEFNAETLEFLRFAELPLDEFDESQNDGCPWVAVDENGKVYTSRFKEPKVLNIFTLNGQPDSDLFTGERQQLALWGDSISSVQGGKVLNGCLYGIDDSDDQEKWVFKIDLITDEKHDKITGYTQKLFRLNGALENSTTGYLLSKLSYLLGTLNNALNQLTNGYFNVQALKYIEAEGVAIYPDPETKEPILHASMILYVWAGFLKYVIIHYRLAPSNDNYRLASPNDNYRRALPNDIA